MRGLFAYSIAFLSALVATGCDGPEGPSLPPDIGTNHGEYQETAGDEGEREARQRPVPAEPQEIGTVVFSSFHGTGLYFQAVVVERRDAEHHVVYADGASEWVDADALIVDSLHEDARIHVRPHYEGAFSAAVVVRRLGDVVYVRHTGGDEGWVALANVRFLPTDPGVPEIGDAPYEPPSGEHAGSVRFVDYRLQGLRFAGVVTAEREDGALHVVYYDSENEWVDARTAPVDRLVSGDVVHVRRTYEPPEWVRGRVIQRIAFALEVELDDGGVAWTSMFRIRIPTDATRATEPPRSEVSVTP